MTLLFRSKSCKLRTNPPELIEEHQEAYEYDDEDEDEDEDEERESDDGYEAYDPISTPLISPRYGNSKVGEERERSGDGVGGSGGSGQFPILDFVVAALRKSLVMTCSVEREEITGLDISCPTNVKHISHVTFDRFNGFLGLPLELQPEVPRKVPSASVSVFGVSPQSMQCSFDERGNSVPTILLMMQKRLYVGGGLQAEGIFRINAENSQEEWVRSQLNKGVVPDQIDVHCLAGLIKAWFRELPRGVLDSLTPEQVMHCNNEDQCNQLVQQLPPTEAALLDWAINLMGDVAQNEHHNKMNARNIAVVFAPNMTQMADPLTALIHAVQVMNFLKTLIERTLRLREESAANTTGLLSFVEPQSASSNTPSSISIGDLIFGAKQSNCTHEQYYSNKLCRSVTLDRLEFSPEKKHRKTLQNIDGEEKPYNSYSGGSSPVMSRASESRSYERSEVEGFLDRLNFRKGVKKLCRHPVFQLSKPAKKSAELGIVNSR